MFRYSLFSLFFILFVFSSLPIQADSGLGGKFSELQGILINGQKHNDEVDKGLSEIEAGLEKVRDALNSDESGDPDVAEKLKQVNAELEQLKKERGKEEGTEGQGDEYDSALDATKEGINTLTQGGAPGKQQGATPSNNQPSNSSQSQSGNTGTGGSGGVHDEMSRIEHDTAANRANFEEGYKPFKPANSSPNETFRTTKGEPLKYEQAWKQGSNGTPGRMTAKQVDSYGMQKYNFDTGQWDSYQGIENGQHTWGSTPSDGGTPQTLSAWNGVSDIGPAHSVPLTNQNGTWVPASSNSNLFYDGTKYYTSTNPPASKPNTGSPGYGSAEAALGADPGVTYAYRPPNELQWYPFSVGNNNGRNVMASNQSGSAKAPVVPQGSSSAGGASAGQVTKLSAFQVCNGKIVPAGTRCLK